MICHDFLPDRPVHSRSNRRLMILEICERIHLSDRCDKYRLIFPILYTERKKKKKIATAFATFSLRYLLRYVLFCFAMHLYFARIKVYTAFTPGEFAKYYFSTDALSAKEECLFRFMCISLRALRVFLVVEEKRGKRYEMSAKKCAILEKPQTNLMEEVVSRNLFFKQDSTITKKISSPRRLYCLGKV